MKFSVKDFFSKYDQIRRKLNGKLHFLCSDQALCCSTDSFKASVHVTGFFLYSLKTSQNLIDVYFGI